MLIVCPLETLFQAEWNKNHFRCKFWQFWRAKKAWIYVDLLNLLILCQLQLKSSQIKMDDGFNTLEKCIFHDTDLFEKHK